MNKSNDEDKKPLRIMLCIPGSHFTHNFLKSFIKTIGWCSKNNISMNVRMKTGANIFAVREEILGAVINEKTKEVELFGGEDYDYILWVDSDMKWEPSDIQFLLDEQKDIISAACVKIDGDIAASYFFKEDRVIFKPKIKNDFLMTDNFVIKNIPGSDIKDMNSPVTISACGFAFILIKKGVFESFNPGWFMQVARKTSDKNYGYFSEDYSFCVRAANAGYNIWLHPKAIIGHQKEIILMPS